MMKKTAVWQFNIAVIVTTIWDTVLSKKRQRSIMYKKRENTKLYLFLKIRSQLSVM